MLSRGDQPRHGMVAVWDWLAVPENQKTLGFLGGGFAVLVGAVWAVFKFFLSSSNVKADRHSIAAGRDANVAQGPPVTFSKTKKRSR